MDFWNIEIKNEVILDLHPSINPLVRRIEKTANDRKCTQEERSF